MSIQYTSNDNLIESLSDILDVAVKVEELKDLKFEWIDACFVHFTEVKMIYVTGMISDPMLKEPLMVYTAIPYQLVVDNDIVAIKKYFAEILDDSNAQLTASNIDTNHNNYKRIIH